MARPTLIYPGTTTTGSGGSSSQALNYGDGTELSDTSGKVTQGATADTIVMRLDDGQVAGTGGIDGMVGGMVWDLGGSITGGVSLNLTWVAKQNITNVVIAVLRASSAPTSLADIDGNSSTRFLQLRTTTSGGVSTYLNSGSGNLATVANENKASSESVTFYVAVDSKGTGGMMSRHYYTASGVTVRSNNTTTSATSGNIYVAMCFSAAATISGDVDIKVKLRGGMPL